MGSLILITGGARSGKSSFAEKLANEKSKDVAYIATSIAFDDEMKIRIKKHKEQRPQFWNTYEIAKDFSKNFWKEFKNEKVVILECVTLWVNNIIFDIVEDFENIREDEIFKIEKIIDKEIENLIIEVNKRDIEFIIVTNELGLGIVPENKLTRIYRDIVGRCNQKIAKESKEVYFVISSIPMKIK